MQHIRPLRLSFSLESHDKHSEKSDANKAIEQHELTPSQLKHVRYTLDADTEKYKNSFVMSTCFDFIYFSFGCCEWLPTDATEEEEDGEVSLLWVMAKARVLQEEVSCYPYLL